MKIRPWILVGMALLGCGDDGGSATDAPTTTDAPPTIDAPRADATRIDGPLADAADSG